jgi:hypothetical protein
MGSADRLADWLVEKKGYEKVNQMAVFQAAWMVVTEVACLVLQLVDRWDSTMA